MILSDFSESPYKYMTKTGKACGVDGLAAEHFIHASPNIHVYLSMLFDCFITHGY